MGNLQSVVKDRDFFAAVVAVVICFWSICAKDANEMTKMPDN